MRSLPPLLLSFLPFHLPLLQRVSPILLMLFFLMSCFAAKSCKSMNERNGDGDGCIFVISKVSKPISYLCKNCQSGLVIAHNSEVNVCIQWEIRRRVPMFLGHESFSDTLFDPTSTYGQKVWSSTFTLKLLQFVTNKFRNGAIPDSVRLWVSRV